MASLYQQGPHAEPEYALSSPVRVSGIECPETHRSPVLRSGSVAREGERLGEVRSHDIRHGQKLLLHQPERVSLHQGTAARGDHYWIHDYMAGPVCLKGPYHRIQRGGIVHHAYLHRIGAYVLYHRGNLVVYGLRRQGMHIPDPHGILHRDGGNGSGAVYSERRECLEVGLQAGTSGRVGSGYGERGYISFLHLTVH